MPAGCEFICKNDKCENLNKGFAITAPWPIGQIELIINSSPVKKFADLRQRLIDQKNTEGRKFALIQFPNEDQIPIIGYRINMWDSAKNCIWQYDLELQGQSLEEALESVVFVSEMAKNGDGLITFNEVVDQGICCPTCHEKMFQNRWFTNEK